MPGAEKKRKIRAIHGIDRLAQPIRHGYSNAQIIDKTR